MSDDTNTVIKDIIDRITDICYYSGNIFELLVSVVIASHFLKRKTSSVASAYFYILFWGYIFDAMYELGFTCQRYLTKDWDSNNVIDLPFIKTYENIIEWYIMLFMGPASVLLSFNRFTAIFLVAKHETIWKKWFPLILAFLLLYPFIIGGFTYFTNLHCRADQHASECIDDFNADFLRSTISNGVCAILSLIIGISTAIMYRIKFSNKSKTQTKQLKIEHKLLLQSVWSASLFGLYAFLGIFYPFFYEKRDDPDFYVLNRIYGSAYDFSYISYHYVSIILLFVFSPVLKKEFLKFYHLQWIFEWNNTKVTVNATTSTNNGSSSPRRPIAQIAVV